MWTRHSSITDLTEALERIWLMNVNLYMNKYFFLLNL